MSLISKVNSKWIRMFFLRALVAVCVLYYFWAITIVILASEDILAALTSLQNIIITIILYTGASALGGSPVIMPLVESLKNRIKGKQEEKSTPENTELEINDIQKDDIVAVVGDRLSKDFQRHEFDCHDGTEVPEVYHTNVLKLATNLQVLRDEIGLPITIVSGYRTTAHNRKVGGKPASKHLLAMAADIKIQGMTPSEVFDKINSLIDSGKMLQGGLSKYPTFVHYDVRGVKARW